MGRIFVFVLMLALIWGGVSYYNGHFDGLLGAAPEPAEQALAEPAEPPARRSAEDVLQQYGAPAARSSAAATEGSANVMPRRGSLPQYVKHKANAAMQASERRAEGR